MIHFQGIKWSETRSLC